ncbi:MAG: conjugal transfer protein TraG N-terminal domain-containing protein [Rickettsia sp.]|uniref:conjugal transfer protein TraG N-terminal domain-containing protein n=1 Tax=Rickettsia sp. TaxID=789 RepID=UPI0039794B42
MNLTIHTYGYIDAMYNTMQAIAMFQQSDAYLYLVQGVWFCMGCFYAVQIAGSTHLGQFKSHIYRVLGICIIVNGLLLPSTHMIIKDHISKDTAKVDHIPLAFAIPVGILEEFGYIITRGFEQAFRPFSNQKFDYFNYGLLFGQRLKQEVKNVRIKDPVNVNNMREFVKRCVVLPAMIGYSFTKEELFATDNIWKLLKEKAGGLRRVKLFEPKSRQYESMTCKEAVAYLERHLFPQEEERILVKFASKSFNQANDQGTYFTYVAKGMPRNPDLGATLHMKHYFKNNIKKAYEVGSAEDLLKQQMMINAISNFRSGSYAVARARMQHESSSLIGSDMASIYLPLMLVVFKCIVYGAFIFVVPMILMSGGFTKYMTYLVIIVSLQLWPALNAILNMIMETYSDFAEGSRQVMSYAAVSTMYKKIDTIVTIAASLQMLVPFLSFWLTKLGGDGIMHLAGNIVGGVQSVSGGVGSEVATNNKSFDNYSSGNQQYGNTSSNKVDTSMQYFDGTNRAQYADGTGEFITQSGEQVFSGGSGYTSSVGNRKLSEADDTQTQLSQGTQIMDSIVDSDRRSLSNTKGTTMSRTSDYVENVLDKMQQGQNFNFEELGEQGKSARKVIDHAQSLSKTYGYDNRQAANAALKAAVTAGTPFSGITGSGASITAEGAISASNESNQSLQDGVNDSKGQSTSEDYNNLIKVASNENWSREQGIDQSVSQGVHAASMEEQRAEKQLAVNQERAEQYHRAENWQRTHGASSNNDVRHEVQQDLEKAYGVSSKEAHDMIERGDPRYRQVWQNRINHRVADVLSSVSAGHSRVTGDSATSRLNEASNNYEQQVNNQSAQNFATAKNVAYNEMGGINYDQVKENIGSKEQQLKGQFQKMQYENSGNYQAIQEENLASAQGTQQEVNIREADRIGQGRFARTAGEVSKAMTKGGAFGPIDVQVGGDKNPSTVKPLDDNKD